MSQEPAIPGADFAQEATDGQPGGESGPGALQPGMEAAAAASGPGWDQVREGQA